LRRSLRTLVFFFRLEDVGSVTPGLDVGDGRLDRISVLIDV